MEGSGRDGVFLGLRNGSMLIPRGGVRINMPTVHNLHGKGWSWVRTNWGMHRRTPPGLVHDFSTSSGSVHADVECTFTHINPCSYQKQRQRRQPRPRPPHLLISLLWLNSVFTSGLLRFPVQGAPNRCGQLAWWMFLTGPLPLPGGVDWST